MSTYYSTLTDVIRYTSVEPRMLGVESHVVMEEIIVQWLILAKDYIDRDRNINFSLLDEVPPVIHDIAKRMVANMIQNAQRQISGSVIEISAKNLVINDAAIFSDGIKEDLTRIPPKPRFRLTVPRGSSDVF